MEAEFSEKRTDDNAGCSLVTGSVFIYSDGTAEGPGIKWAIFKQKSGDIFIFRKLFDTLTSLKDIQNILLGKEKE